MLIVDIITAILLMINIVYSWQLNKKILEVRNSKIEFGNMIKKLDESILRSEYSIDELKELTSKTVTNMHNQIDRAKNYSDELAFLTDRAALQIDRLDQLITVSRQLEKILQAENMQNEKVNRSSPEVVTAPPRDTSSKKVVIESLLKKIVATKNGTIEA